MPLIQSSRPRDVSQNIKTEIAAGKPQNVAIAIAERVADKAKKGKK